jgi:hypothetical protein
MRPIDRKRHVVQARRLLALTPHDHDEQGEQRNTRAASVAYADPCTPSAGIRRWPNEDPVSRRVDEIRRQQHIIVGRTEFIACR